jgi:hypothetical protein
VSSTGGPELRMPVKYSNHWFQWRDEKILLEEALSPSRITACVICEDPQGFQVEVDTTGLLLSPVKTTVFIRFVNTPSGWGVCIDPVKHDVLPLEQYKTLTLYGNNYQAWAEDRYATLMMEEAGIFTPEGQLLDKSKDF